MKASDAPEKLDRLVTVGKVAFKVRARDEAPIKELKRAFAALDVLMMMGGSLNSIEDGWSSNFVLPAVRPNQVEAIKAALKESGLEIDELL